MLFSKPKTRREFIQDIGFATVATLFPITHLSANCINAGIPSDPLTLGIIDHVLKLTGNRDVTLTILQPEGSLGNVKPAGELFSQCTGVSIKYIEASLDEINAKIMAQAFSNDTYFDIALPATFGLPDLVEANVILDLTEFANKYQPYGYDKSMLYSIGDVYKGKFYGYQTDGDTYVMFYNKSWLNNSDEKNAFKEKYGYALDVPKTWQQLDQMMEFFHRPEKNMYGGALFRNKDYIAWEWWSRFHAKGNFPFNQQLQPQINSQAGIDALSEMISASERLYPGAASNGLFENWEDYSKGNIFCNIGWGGTQKYLNRPNSNMRNNLSFGPTPGGEVNGELLHVPYFNWGWNYTVTNSSQEKEIAYLYTLFACSPEMSTLAVQFPDGYFDPFRDEHYQDEKIIAAFSKEFLDTHQFSMQNSIPDLYLTGQGDYWDALKNNLDLANRGKMSVKLALDTTVKLWNQISIRHGVQNQLEQWNYLRALYPENIRNKLV